MDYLRTLLLLMGGKKPYYKKVLGYDPIAYWPLWEVSGTVAECLVNSAQNGTYARDVSTMGTGTGIGDGKTAPTFDGTNDYVDCLSASFNAAFNGQLGTLMAWFRVANVGAWTDGANRDVAIFLVDNNNYLAWRKLNANNFFSGNYVAGGTIDYHSFGGLTATGWMRAIVTWNKAADQLYYYLTDQADGSDAGLGTWAGSLDRAVIGASSTTPTNQWLGNIAHVAVWDRVLSEAVRDALDFP